MSRARSKRHRSGGRGWPGTPPWETLTRRPRRPLPDAGEELLDQLWRDLSLDDEDEWAVREERAFMWWPFSYALRVLVTESAEAFGDPTVMIRAITDMVAFVEAPAEEVRDVIVDLNARASLATVVWNPVAGLVMGTTAAWIHDGNRSLLPILSMAVQLMAMEALMHSPRLAQAIGGQPALSARPGSEVRTEPSPRLWALRELILAAGDEASQFRRHLGEAAAAPLPWVDHEQGTDSFVGLVPFGDEPATLELRTDRPHDFYGSGLEMTLRLPFECEPDEARRLAWEYSWSESNSSTGFAQLGAWCVDPDDDGQVAFRAFVPSLLARPGLVATLCFHMALRSRWAADVLEGG